MFVCLSQYVMFNKLLPIFVRAAASWPKTTLAFSIGGHYNVSVISYRMDLLSKISQHIHPPLLDLRWKVREILIRPFIPARIRQWPIVLTSPSLLFGNGGRERYCDLTLTCSLLGWWVSVFPRLMSLLEVRMNCRLVSSSMFQCYPWRCRGA